MSSIVTVINDLKFRNLIQQSLKNNSFEYICFDRIDDAVNCITGNDSTVLFTDYENLVLISKDNSIKDIVIADTVRTVLLFSEDEIDDVLKLYNEGLFQRTVIKREYDISRLDIIIREIVRDFSDRSLTDLTDGILNETSRIVKPITEISSLLNERLSGYEFIANVFISCIGAMINTSEDSVNTIRTFVDNIIKDYIHIFLINEPNIRYYFDGLETKYNRPDSKKYFKFSAGNINLSGDLKYKLIFTLNLLAASFDYMYPMYRGSISVVNSDTSAEINAIYEVRKNHNENICFTYVNKVIDNLIRDFTSDIKFGTKDSLIQYKIRL